MKQVMGGKCFAFEDNEVVFTQGPRGESNGRIVKLLKPSD